MNFNTAIEHCPLIAILRGVQPHEVLEVGQVLLDAGFSMIEVPLNSPEPLKSIELLSKSFSNNCLVGAGTVLSTEQVTQVVDAGGQVIISPNFDADVVAASVALGAISLPGIATPSEGFAALKAGASGLKLFPAESIEPNVVKAWRAVFAPSVMMFPVGGITPASMQGYFDVGANGFGIGSALYKPGRSIDELAQIAKEFITTLRS